MSAKLFSELKLVTDNLLSIYAAANWEATESKVNGLLPMEALDNVWYGS